MNVQVIDDRFVLDPVPPRVGGTGRVYRARDHVNDGACVAIKLFDGEAIDDELRLECYMRERAALQALTHPNIVRLIAAGRDESVGKHYLALEWTERSLVDYLEQVSPAERQWGGIARSVLRPLLRALAAAHARNIWHRDVKPANVMVGDDDAVRLTDFGIAKLLDSVRFGLTVGDLHSKPFAAPERDAGDVDERSDLYSVGVTMIDVLGSRRLGPTDVPHEVLAALAIDDDAAHFLRALTADDPAERPTTASLALAELERLLAWAPAPTPQSRPRLRVALTKAVLTRGRAVLSLASESEARRAIVKDLNTDRPTIVRDRRAQLGWDSEHAVALDLVGNELLFSARFDRDGSGTLVITGMRPVPPSVLERRRDDGIEVEHELIFDGLIAGAREGADRLIEQVSEHEAAAQEAARAQAETALFERWSAVLEAKTALEVRREQAIVFDGVRREGDLLVFTIDRDLDDSYVGQTRRVPLRGTGAVIGDIAYVGERELGLTRERGNPHALPDRGQLLIDRGAARHAIDRQKSALSDVQDGESARADLGELLVHPGRAAPMAVRSPGPFLQELDLPKREAVEAALASPDFTLVQGPPGTGKTTFIAELVAQLLNARPDARVLLSSQTHIGVDNAAVKIAALRGPHRMVRLGRHEQIDPEAHNLTVPAQLQTWQREAQTRGRAWLDAWGTTRGISREALAAYGAAADLTNARAAEQRLLKRLQELDVEAAEILDRLTDPDRSDPTSTSTGEMLRDDEDELAAVQDEAEARRIEHDAAAADAEAAAVRLRAVVGGSEWPGEADVDEFLKSRFPVATADLDEYQRLLALQDEWMLRFGQGEGFDQALVAQAQVVAGTCIGLAGALDAQQTFDVAIVDEVSKATPTEALVPMARSRHWVLVGDERQLPPFVDNALIDQGLLEDHGLTKHDLEETLFAQLSTLPADRRRVLSVQHRMLRPIGQLVSECFYDGGLDSSRSSSSDIRCLDVFPQPVTWYSTARVPGRREKPVGNTYWNESELRLIRKLLNKLQARASQTDEYIKVAVVTGYGEQARRVHRDLRPQTPKWTHLAIDVHPVDSFQGQERDVVIYSVTRSNAENNLGFLRSERRINVALSRAQDALVIVGDARFCLRARGGDSPFARVLTHIRSSDGCALLEARR